MSDRALKLHRAILPLSLAGMVLAAHLWVQKARDFDQGCLGLGRPNSVADGGCRADALQEAGKLLGVSNAAWGFAFFFALALLAGFKLLAPPAKARRAHLASEGLVAIALLYCGYLFYVQAWVAHAFCVLCLTTSGVVAVLAIVHGLLRRAGGVQAVPAEGLIRELGWAGLAAFGGVGGLLAVLFFVDHLGTRPLGEGSSRREIEKVLGDSLGKFIDPEKLESLRACRVDEDAPRLELPRIITPDTPSLGRADGLPVVIFYDPNCGHCAEYHATWLRLVERYKDRVKFYVLPRIIWEESVLPVQALHVARKEGKYFELWARLLARTAERKETTRADLESVFREVGLSTENLDARLAAVRAEVAEERRMVRPVVPSVPAIYLAGLPVASLNQSESCLSRLLETPPEAVVQAAGRAGAARAKP